MVPGSGSGPSGNPKPPTLEATARTRRAQAIYQRGTDVPVSADYLERHAQDLTVLVPPMDGRVWRNGDVCMVGGSPQPDGTYTGGTAYTVDGDPADWNRGPGTPPTGYALQLRRVAGGQGAVA